MSPGAGGIFIVPTIPGYSILFISVLLHASFVHHRVVCAKQFPNRYIPPKKTPKDTHTQLQAGLYKGMEVVEGPRKGLGINP